MCDKRTKEYKLIKSVVMDQWGYDSVDEWYRSEAFTLNDLLTIIKEAINGQKEK